MPHTGPIIIVDDDVDDQGIIIDIFKDMGLGNELICFTNSCDALTFLRTTDKKPAFILSDINMPQKNGLQFKAEIDEDETLRMKSIPFIIDKVLKI